MECKLECKFACKQNMANTRFFLDKRNAKEGKPVVLKIAIAHQHKSALISLDAKILPAQWENNKIVRHPDKQALNTYINLIKSQVDSLIVRWTNEGSINSMSASEIKDRCMEALDPDRKKAKEEKTTFLYRFNQYASRMKPGSKRTYDHTLNRLKAFKGEEYLRKLKFEDMTADWMKDFDAFMAKTAPSKNSRNIHFRNIRTVFNAAIEDNITTAYPFRRFKIKREVTAKRDLTVEELRSSLRRFLIVCLIEKDTLSGLGFDYLFCLFCYAAGHALPVEESLTLYSGTPDNVGDELDPLVICEGVEEGIELCGLSVLYVVVGHAFRFVCSRSLLSRCRDRTSWLWIF